MRRGAGALALGCLACSNGVADSGAGSAPMAAAPAAPTCDDVRDAPEPLPGVPARHLTLDYWLETLGQSYDLDAVLMQPEDVEAHNRSLLVERDGYEVPLDLLAPLDTASLARKVSDRREWARDKLSGGEFVQADGRQVAADRLKDLSAEVSWADENAELRVVLAEAQIHCAPLPFSFYSPSLDLRLNRNACSRLRPQEVVRVVAAWPNGMRLVQARYSFGWLAADASLSPRLPDELAAKFVAGERLQVHGGDLVVAADGASESVPAGTLLTAASEGSEALAASVATRSGFVRTGDEQSERLRTTRRDLTRRALFSEVFRYLGGPYGLGGSQGGRDCSRLLMDTFQSFGLRLPRHSAWQAQAGTFSIDVSAEVGDSERRLLIDAAARRGATLLYFPGHIMLYLGRDDSGTQRALHAFGEYLEPCGSGEASRGETLLRVKRATVSDLELGRGTTRRAFIERITRVVVLGGSPGPELAGVARWRPAGAARVPSRRECRDRPAAAIYAMPERPNAEQPLRVITATQRDPGPATLTLIDPDGIPQVPKSVRLGGPPFGRVVSVDDPRPGEWKAVFADGQEVIACQRIRVRKRRPRAPEPQAGPVWKPIWRWSVANENLYALFVERLFDYPADEDRVWPNLHALLRDESRNLLYDYRSAREEEAIEFTPDCADLPYTLRAYFAWKIRLPFGFRRCTRARAGKPPDCDQDEAGGNRIENLMDRLELAVGKADPEPLDDVRAFDLFVNRKLRHVVHSSSARTLPEDDRSDFYPVPLQREHLSPGTLFADPYGHLLVVAAWKPQGVSDYGMLVGVDAQPDGTIGRRRFWRGSFLFDPDTRSGGAGFKAFRPLEFVREPLVVDRKTGKVVAEADQPLEAWPTAQVEAPSGTSPLSGPANPEPLPAAADPIETLERIGYLEEVENADLRRARVFAPYSTEQYTSSADDFYAAIETLINPRPLDPTARQRSLVDALYEAVSRRVTSIDNGERWAREHPGETIEMPQGARIFLAAGPWEDFSTPSRDLRLLISVDSVMGFPERVRRSPARFGMTEDSVAGQAAAIERVLAAELSSRTFRYRRSDGGLQELTLADLVERAQRLEMAYNPNDCAEIRWGAAPGSSEMENCSRRAPEPQRLRMQQHRPWFVSRKRPPR